jgi:hypothetical protein
MRLTLLLYLFLPTQLIAQRLLPAAITNDLIHVRQNDEIHSLGSYDTYLLVGGDFEGLGNIQSPDICLYDGNVYSAFPTPLMDEFNANIVFDIYASNDEVIVAGNLPYYNGLARYTSGTWEMMGPTGATTIKRIFPYNNGYICLFEQSILFYDGSIWSTIDGLENQNIEDITVFNTILYAIANHQIHYFNGDTWTTIVAPNFEASELSIANNLLYCGGMEDTVVKYYSIESDLLTPFGFETISNDFVGSIFYLNNQYLVSNFRDHNDVDEFELETKFDDNCIFQSHDYSIRSAVDYQNKTHIANHSFSDQGHFILSKEWSCPYLANPAFVTYQKVDGSTLGQNSSEAAHLIKNNGAAIAGTIFSSSLWMATIIDNDTIASCDRYGMTEERSFGPKSDAIDLEYYYKYNRIFRISSDMIDEHLAHYGDPEYVIPMDIIEWPAHGDITNGEAPFLAPFKDLNQDGIYQPELGDYPAIKGDQCAFFILNDCRPMDPGFVSFPDSLGFEEHIMQYAFESGPSALLNTLFVEHRLINRSNRTYDTIHCGIWNDLDIGNSADDYIGTDVLRNCVYAYNGDAFDQPSSQSPGFGDLPYSTGCVLLNREMTNSMYHRIGTNPIMGDPANVRHCYHYLNSLWKNGDSLMYGGNGYDGVGITEVPASYVYTSPPLALGSSDWNEEIAGNQPGDRRAISGFKLYDFAPDESTCIQYAFVNARAEEVSDLTHFQSVFELLERIDSVTTFHQNELTNCMEDAIANQEEVTPHDEDKLIAYPNPGTEYTNVILPDAHRAGTLTLYSSSGQIIFIKKIDATNPVERIDTSALPAGLYHLEWHSDQQHLLCKLALTGAP